MEYDFQPLWDVILQRFQHPSDLLLPLTQGSGSARCSTEADMMMMIFSQSSTVPHMCATFLVDYMVEPSQSYIHVGHEGHLLLGMFVQGDQQFFTTLIGGQNVHSCKSNSGFNPVVHNTFIPLLNLRFHEVDIRFAYPKQAFKVTLVFGYVSSVDLRGLALSKPLVASTSDDQMLVITSGMAGIVGPFRTGLPNYTYLPEYKSLPALKEKQEWQQKLDQELMQKTWHYDRLAAWCLDTEELFESPLAAPSQAEVSHIQWLDSVGLVDDALTKKNAR